MVVELKTVDFEPEFAGKLNFYLKAVDEQLRREVGGPRKCPSKAKAPAAPIGVGSQNSYLLGQPLRFDFRAEAPRGVQKAGARHRAVGIFSYQNKVLVFNHFIVPWVGRCFDSIIDAGTKLTCPSGGSVQASVFA